MADPHFTSIKFAVTLPPDSNYLKKYGKRPSLGMVALNFIVANYFAKHEFYNTKDPVRISKE